MFRLLFLGNGWADCVEIWYALGNPLVTAYAVVTGGVSLHMRTCTPRFCISQTARPIVFKFGVWVSSHYLSAFHKSWVGYLCTCARADQSMEWTGLIRWIHNPVQSRRIWIGLDQKFTNSADSGLDWIQKCAMCIPYLETLGSFSLS